MSRIGKQPVTIPTGVQVQIKDSRVSVKGPLGELALSIPAPVQVEQKSGQLVLTLGPSDNPNAGALYGMARARLANMVDGVREGYKKELEIHGLGYKATLEGETVIFNIGRTHPVKFAIPKGIKVEVDKKQTKLSVSGIYKDLVGQTAAQIRELRPPEPYKSTGIRYSGERIIRKAGKAAAGATGAAGAGAAPKK
jgi:large subunit ribosomal protein L6